MAAAEKQALLAELRASGDEAVATLRALPAATLARVCSGDWTGQQVVAHLASVEWTYPRLIDLARQPAAAEGAAPSASISGGIDAYNERQVARRAGASRDQLLEEFARNRAATVAAVEATDEALLAAPVRTAAGLEGPLGSILRFVAVEHVANHVRDVTGGA